jgi:flagellar protein FliO/FliZ
MGPAEPVDPPAMDFGEIARMVFSLAIVLGLIGLLVVAARRFGPETLRQLQVSRAERRLSVIESLVLDPSRRLVLVRFDKEERLILLGEGRLLATQTAAPVTGGGEG